MSEQHHLHEEWTGTRGKFNAWFFGTGWRRFVEKTIFGNYWPHLHKEIAKQITNGDEKILDVGAGSGNFSIPIAKQLSQGKVYCLDLSDVMLSHLDHRARKASLEDKIEIIKDDATKSGLESDSVNWAVSGNFMHEMAEPEKVVAEMHRVLKPGGSLFLVDFKDWHGYHGGDSHGPFSEEQFQELINSSDFEDVEVKLERHFVIGTARKK